MTFTKKILSFSLAAVILATSMGSIAYAQTGEASTGGLSDNSAIHPVTVASTVSSTTAAATTSSAVKTSSSATATADINTMAAALNKLGILQGSNGNYLLNDKIERSQAAALIIRMLGKENIVKQNTEKLKSVKYPDVSSKDWYAPYVGYCTQYNIMGGYPNGKFGPKDYISEKAFLKMALCALGYVYGTDFDWTNVYLKACAAGIVTDQSYLTRTQDNVSYLRSGAARAIYNSLNAIKKGTSRRMIYTLMDEGVFTRDLITASGVLAGYKAAEVDMITATASNSIEVNLNVNLQNVSTSAITIIDSSTAGGILAVQSITYTGDRIQVTTAGQVPNKTYTVRIDSITDASGFISGQLTGTFKGFVKPQVTSDLFKVSKVEQQSVNVINVYFTQPVNTNSETPAYYELAKNGATLLSGTTQNITVKKLQSADNGVSIYLKTITLAQNETYSLKLNGKLASNYGVRLDEGAGESYDFVATAANSGDLTVTSVMAWTSTSVRIIFNRDVDPAWAGKFLNYSVSDTSNAAISVTKAVMSGEGDASARTVMLSLASPLDKTRQYKVRIEYIPDAYTKQNVIEGKSFPFSGIYLENAGLALNQAASTYNNCAVLIFNRALDPTIAANTSRYVIKGVNDGAFSVTPIKAYYTEQYGQYTVKLYLPAGCTFNSTQKYRVYADGLKDALGGSQAALLSADFTGGSNSIVRPQLIDAVTVSKDAVKLMFNMEIAFDLNNVKTSNFTLEYAVNGETLKMEPIGVTYVDAQTLVLRFDELDTTRTYLLRFTSITDYSGVYSRTAVEGGNTITVRYGK